ncbi:membrane lipoprotein lipid attachment site-containing protein [Tissierella creatinophila]|uniref:Lipoprotein n=1 Tax=Tissierella creatinophila DSM 6911 TaxID=1123403 RepID=A0A1U7M681_TISCR|nr:membrane lipoprotein lipid attachment site-containing protein [Tissierella creatinophila]OLS02760.1 hypothetical protein TICRE_12450 [Tissierella creatinophila DSM 6911]
MRKLLYVLGLSLILTGCSSSYTSSEYKDIIVPEKVDYILDSNNKAMYIDDDLKEVIFEINNLREKYKDSNDENESNLLYIDIYANHDLTINFDNESINNKEYFNDVVGILDKSVAKGLKDYIEEVKDKEIEDNKIALRKIGMVAVYAEDRGENKENFISVKFNFASLKDKYYSDLLNKVSKDKYFLNNIIMGEKLNMIDFVNLNNFHPIYEYGYFSIRYNMYLKDKDIEKVNILMQGKDGLKLEQDDIDVFANLLDTLELKEKEKDLLLNDYKEILQTKTKNKNISLDNYKVLINTTKGNNYSGEGRKLVYFSIEKS